MNEKFFVAWWGNGSWGEVSVIFNDRKAAGKWLIEKRMAEDVERGEVEGFSSKSDAEYYKKNGKRRDANSSNHSS